MLLPFLVWVDFDSRMKQTASEKATSYRLIGLPFRVDFSLNPTEFFL
jgi:hypothetical protein